jgi:UDP-galactopyranose mutase|tara:strand:- start:279 stop:1289 length:1011 start_codon:yes stop_codon:yes gene_type:complete
MSFLVVGAGFAGAVIAHELANDGHQVTLIDERDHIGGNAYDYTNEHGIRIHKYGPHIFHTSNEKVYDWITQFGEWVEYKHKVKAQLSNGEYVTLPVNKLTKEIVGEENILDIFYRPYTKKMWDKEIEELDPNILKRVAVRDDDNEYYFPKDIYQIMPKDGYTKVFEKILDHQNIVVKLNTPFHKDMESDYQHVFNSMPIDVYYDYRFGELPYRSLKFHNVNLPMVRALPASVVNFTNNSPYTRIAEWKNFPEHGSNDKWTTLTYEEPCDYIDNDYQRYYPVKDIDGINQTIYKTYKEIENTKVTFIGRCGMYVYIDMHQAVMSSLAIVKRFKETIK